MNTLSRSFLGLNNMEVVHRICVTWIIAECEVHTTTVAGLKDPPDITPGGEKPSNIRVHITIYRVS